MFKITLSLHVSQIQWQWWNNGVVCDHTASVCAAKSADSGSALVLFLIKLCPRVQLSVLASVYDHTVCVCAAIQWQWEYTGIVCDQKHCLCMCS